MKIYIKNILEKVLKCRLMIILIFFYCCLSAYIFFSFNIETNPEKIYYIYIKFYSYRILSYITIPIFLVFIWKSSLYFDCTNVILKYSNINTWLKYKNITNGIIVFIYTCIINIPLFVIMILNISKLDIEIYMNFIITLSFQVIGFLIICNLYSIIELLIDFKNIGFLGFILFNIVLEIQKIAFNIDFKFLVDYMSLGYKATLNNYNINIMDFLNLIIYFIIYIVIYKIGVLIIKNKDFYGRKSI